MIVCSVPSAKAEGAGEVSLVAAGNGGGTGGVVVAGVGGAEVTAGAGTLVLTGRVSGLKGGGPVSTAASFFAWSAVFLHPAISNAPKSTT